MENSKTDYDPFDLMLNVERIKKLSPEIAKNELLNLGEQFKLRYKYLVGEWANSKKAKSTITGKIVKNEEVKKYLDSKS